MRPANGERRGFYLTRFQANSAVPRTARGGRIGPLQFVASEGESTLLIRSGPFREGAAFDVDADRMVRIIDRVGPEAGDIPLQDRRLCSIGSGLALDSVQISEDRSG